MTEKIPEGSRVRVTLDCVVDYDDGAGDVRVRPVTDRYAAAMSVSREAISDRRAPIQKPGAKVRQVAFNEEYEVVLHDAEAKQYVLRHAEGFLIVVLDDQDVLPIAEWRAIREADPVRLQTPELAIPEAPAQADRTLVAAPLSEPKPQWIARDYPIGTELGAEDLF